MPSLLARRSCVSSLLPSLVLALAACSSEATAPTTNEAKGPAAGVTPEPGAASPAVPTTTTAVATCEGRAPQPLDKTWTLDVGGAKRAFEVHVPASYDPRKATPLVLNFHGYQMNAALEEWLTVMSKKADAEGFVLVYPEGTGSPSSFNGGACCGQAAKDGTNDLEFTARMLDALEAEICVDTKRIFSTGMSNGGFMSHRLACEMSQRIAAIAPVGGVNGTPDCRPTRPVSVIQFHGTDDPTIPYEGNARYGWPSAADTVKGWADRNGCTGAPTETYAKGAARCVTYGGCREASEVTLCTVDKGGHTWPGGSPVPESAGQGSTTSDISANDVMWDFWKRHPKL